MGKTHFQPTKENEVYKILADVIEANHSAIHRLSPPLAIGVLFVTVDDPEKEVALKDNGYTAAALISNVSQRDRAAGGPDVLLQIDGNTWLDLTAEQKVALVDHEMLHIEFPKSMKAEDGSVHADLDALERPKVGIRQHDFQIGGFYSIVEHHGEAAIEKAYLNAVNERIRQKPLPFGNKG